MGRKRVPTCVYSWTRCSKSHGNTLDQSPAGSRGSGPGVYGSSARGPAEGSTALCLETSANLLPAHPCSRRTAGRDGTSAPPSGRTAAAGPVLGAHSAPHSLSTLLLQHPARLGAATPRKGKGASELGPPLETTLSGGASRPWVRQASAGTWSQSGHNAAAVLCPQSPRGGRCPGSPHSIRLLAPPSPVSGECSVPGDQATAGGTRTRAEGRGWKPRPL